MKKRNRKKHAGPLLLILCGWMICLSACTATPPAAAAIKDGHTRAGVVYIDAGHGGFDNGATAQRADGTWVAEKNITLDLARRTGEKLQALGYTVMYAREGDERLTYTTSGDEVRARCIAAGTVGADLLISLHGNAYSGPGRAFGARIYYDPDNPGSTAYATLLRTALAKHTGTMSGRPAACVGDGDFGILSDKSRAAVLFEAGFLSDAADLDRLCDPVYLDAQANALAESADRFLCP